MARERKVMIIVSRDVPVSLLMKIKDLLNEEGFEDAEVSLEDTCLPYGQRHMIIDDFNF